ncbi:type I secretion system permease/ATPase [Govanella unica]|uniref:Type I secretion system permease/ATPase n=1 Tax=Govanella unica TaxID=2975056 RepID=A0A9X3TVF3_9PROT|nr:type I secretion system permease/ATPase [Govania unica]MDA5192490.1 type I secretion system permease/ATPase [Govania unica]
MTAAPAKLTLKTALGGVRHEFKMAGVFSFFINLLMLVSPIFMLQVYDRVLTSRNDLTLVMLTLLAVVLLGVMAALDAFRSKLLVRVSKRVDNLTNNLLFDGVFAAAVLRPGLGSAQYFRDMDSVRQFMTGGPVFALFDGPWVPIYLLIVFLMHPLLGLVALFGGILIFALAWLNDRATRSVLKQASEHAMMANDVIERSLRNAEVLRAMGMGEGIRRVWRRYQNEALIQQCIASDRAGVMVAVSKAARMILQVLMLAAGAWLAIRQSITPGMIVASSIIMGRGLAPIEQAIGGWKNFVGARTAFNRLNALLLAVPDETERMTLPRPKGALSVDRVIAAPPGVKSPVIKGVSFEVAAGESIGIVGPSAAGKTTLARLILGVWPPRAGYIRLDGAEIYGWNRAELGPAIGYLPQDVELFSGTVAENIARFGVADPDKVVKAARDAGVHDMILGLADGYDSQIGTSGTNLSAGQRQRVGLARALYGDPSFIVLDEPNANLDTDGEAALAQAVRALRADKRTVIVITHRSAVLEQMDKLMVLKNGQIAAFGPLAEVMVALNPAPEPVGVA